MKTIIVDGNSKNIDSIDFGITAHGGWYKPTVSWGTYQVKPQHDYDPSWTYLHTLKISESIPDGIYALYIEEYPLLLKIEEGKLSLWMNAQSSWCNSQTWWYNHHTVTALKPGIIFVDNEDVYEHTISIITDNKTKQLTVRTENFAKAQVDATEAGFTEVEINEVLKLTPKGQKIKFLNCAVSIVQEGFFPEQVIEMLKENKMPNVFVFSNYARLKKNVGVVTLERAEQILEKAYAWAYLKNSLPEVEFVGHFDDALASLSSAIKNNIFLVRESVSTKATLGSLVGNELDQIKRKLA